MLRLIDINNFNKKRVILVDHNEVKQSVDGLNEASSAASTVSPY